MNRVARRALCVCAMVFLAASAGALTRKDIKNVDSGALTSELQKTAPGDGIHMAWWIPIEFWEDGDVSKGDQEELVRIMGKYSLLAVAQADISRFGTIAFYEREVIVKGMTIEFTDGKSAKLLKPLDEYPDELRMILKVMTPMLESALGNTGKNLNFFVLSDEGRGGRLISPYENSVLSRSPTSRASCSSPSGSRCRWMRCTCRACARMANPRTCHGRCAPGMAPGSRSDSALIRVIVVPFAQLFEFAGAHARIG
jgi:hypothetical protein